MTYPSRRPDFGDPLAPNSAVARNKGGVRYHKIKSLFYVYCNFIKFYKENLMYKIKNDTEKI